MADGSMPKPIAPGRAAEAPSPGTLALPPPNIWQRTFAALHYPNYRRWFLGQLVSLVGTWMQITAQSFLVFQLTHSTAYLGYVGFAAGVPSLLFMLFGGVVVDRVARRKLLVITQSTMMVLALGTANAFDAPAGQAFVPEQSVPLL